MRIIKTEDLSSEKPLDYLDNLLVYNGLDCCLTYEILDRLLPQLIPAIYKLTDEGERRLTVDRKALEKIEGYFYAEPIVRHLYLLREHGKKISFLNTAVDGDGRLRTSFSIAGTTTGRLASSFSEFGT